MVEAGDIDKMEAGKAAINSGLAQVLPSIRIGFAVAARGEVEAQDPGEPTEKLVSRCLGIETSAHGHVNIIATVTRFEPGPDETEPVEAQATRLTAVDLDDPDWKFLSVVVTKRNGGTKPERIVRAVFRMTKREDGSYDLELDPAMSTGIAA